MEISAHILMDIAGAQARETRILVIELCGVFWIAAEMVILFFVIEARRHVMRNPLPTTAVWDRVATRRTAVFVLFLAVTLTTVVIRPLLWMPLSVRLHGGSLPVDSAALYDFASVKRHLALWAAFVTMWVVLEAAIVYQGYRAYRLFRNRLMPQSGGPIRPPSARHSAWVLLLMAALAAAASFTLPAFAAQAVTVPAPNAAGYWSQVVLLSESWLFPYRNAVYLYLRLAGVVWIGVEWIAALVLWRTHLLVSGVLSANRAPS